MKKYFKIISFINFFILAFFAAFAAPQVFAANASLTYDGPVYVSNEISDVKEAKTPLLLNDTTDVINNLKQNFYTGGNVAEFNAGTVRIITGDISGIVSILNSPLNGPAKNPTDNDKDKSPAGPMGGNVPSPTQTNPSNMTTHITEAANYIAAQLSIPEAGNSWQVLALYGNIMMLLLGAYLRLRSGRSPGSATFV